MAMPGDLCGDGALRRMWPNFKPYHKAGRSRNTANANQTSTHVTNQSNTPLGGKGRARTCILEGYFAGGDCISRVDAFRRRQMMLDWNEYQKEVGGRLGELAKLSPDTLKGYLTLSGENAKRA